MKFKKVSRYVTIALTVALLSPGLTKAYAYNDYVPELHTYQHGVSPRIEIGIDMADYDIYSKCNIFFP